MWSSVVAFIKGSSSVVQLACVDFGIQWGLWTVSAALHTEKFYDLAGSSTFAALVYLAFDWSRQQSGPQWLQRNMVLVWAARLGLFLFVRVLKEGGDRRFNRARDSPATLFAFWTMQGVWVIVTLLPTLVMMDSETRRQPSTQHYVGWTMWAVGFVFEVIADYQKSVFRNDPANKGQFIDTGLWSISRHPNYFGEILLWFGLYVSASVGWSGRRHLLVLCPLFNYLLISRLSGVPPLEKAAAKRWGSDPRYRRYASTVPELVPFIGFT
ncbi:hypothetical protein FJT64_013590 [Amphibalanus amphitrite]|uniref:Uncharacterized protein n=1 Tax=Amphibalanus amphitrite TaxID=1232801 RepID=A0A6A4VA12_AMPAM|nr:uncharacterized protein LOC122370458 [Amphibalanus amphitrite]XP_043202043.1 uncharacterized protein LOC122370458 [Amphibalanus amphitrite]XP_043202044.1 uncharacterized protein LOC122370458 [Amphibalanus amphitrite]XP_043202045.1 uncharacterized protein LOC122370458 [Amphibalanus amphitrite]XP_043202046.1 uncharacterized protein LOC122370458 [Amphibalanus amphitrite]XP_043202047.1 uncharacterized protein LOC122370458 [Amphibalanus amphitrite]XP_043202048.1 uncharacterized protein LOC12237